MKYHIEFDIDFKRNPYHGKYIVVEGIDGSGKTTQVRKLAEYYTQKGFEVVATREPRKDNKSLVGELIQKILHGKSDVPSVAFQYLFSADREMHHAELILPSLEKGKIVISDRCFWSAIPYGLLDRKTELDSNTVEYMLAAQSILSMYHQFVVPDYTVYLDIPLDVALKRLERQDDVKEIYEEKEKLEKIIKGYEWLIREFRDEFLVIEGTAGVEEVTAKIVSKIKI